MSEANNSLWVPFSERSQNMLLHPCEYIQHIPGKDFRRKLISAFNFWFNVSDDKVQTIGDIVDMIFDSVLLYEDIQENTTPRHGIPSSHSVYGLANTINAANFGIILVMYKLQNFHAQGIPIYCEQMSNLLNGLGMEIYWRNAFECPTEEEYMNMANRKTGSLFVLALRLLQDFSEVKIDFTNLASILAVYYQIRRDYCNLTTEETSDMKGYCADISDGKFIFPIVHDIKTAHREDNRISSILLQRTQDVEVKKYFLNVLEESGSFQYTRNTLDKLDAEARAEVARLGGNPMLDAILDELLNWKSNKRSQIDTFHLSL